MGQLPYRQCKNVAAAENRVTGQERDWPGELSLTLWFEAPGLQGCKVIFAWANLRFPVEGYSFAIAKTIEDLDHDIIVSARAVADIDDEGDQVFEVTGNPIQRGLQSSHRDAFQLENTNAAK